MKNFLSSTNKKALAMFLSLALLLSGAKVFSDFAKAETVDDSRYNVVYEKFEQMQRTPPLAPSEVYSRYGAMNGDYYVIAMEENLRWLNGEKNITFQDLQVILDGLEKDGTISMTIRKSLREAVATYGLDESLIPEDPDFAPQPVNTSGSNMGYISDEEVDRMIEEGLIKVDNDPTPTATPSPAETAEPINTTFADVSPDAWYAEAVAGMVASGLVKGKDDGLFHPDDTITIAEWCTLLYRITYRNATEGPITSAGIYFDHWAASAIACCYNHGYTEMSLLNLTVYGTGEPVEDAIAQRGEAITAVVKILEKAYLKDGLLDNNAAAGAKVYTWNDIPDAVRIQENVEPSGVSTTGPDKGKKYYGNTHYWDPDRILDAYNMGITNGVDSSGTFNPDGVMTRAQACKMLFEAGLDHCLNLHAWGQSSIM